MKPHIDRMVLTADLIGTFVFAIEGATAAVAGRLDLLGLMVLAFSTALGGGVVRDLLIGATPPNAIKDWRYPAIAFSGAATVFLFHGFVDSVPRDLLVGVDAAGLSLFAVAGAAKALDYGINPFMAVLMGAITGVGGGTIRDVLLAQVPHVLQADIYAVAAMAGATVMIVGLRLRAPKLSMALAGAVVCFALRMVSYTHGWNLPKVSGR